MIIHVVQSGDTLYKIAQKYDVPVNRIISDNMLNNPNELTLGQTLVILIPKRVYTVQSGDTLENIASKMNVTVNELWQNNPQLGGKDKITSGQQLVISYDGTKKGALEVNGYAYAGASKDIIQQISPYLTYLSIFAAGIDDDGTLLTPDDSNILSSVKPYSVIPLLVVSIMDENGSFSGERADAFVNNDDAQAKFIEQLIPYLTKKGYGGVNIDLEYLTDSKAYSDFISKLTKELNNIGLTVMVAVAPRTSSTQKGLLYEGHDYALLGNAANDIQLMTYEWGYANSEPMAVAPIDKVYDVVSYAVSEIPASKLFLGIPNYGYDWKDVKPKQPAKSLGNAEATERAIDKGASILFDETAKSPWYEYWADNVRHEVWFEDARSIEAKLAIAREFALKGVGIWNIMRSFPQLWLVLSQQYEITKKA